MKRRRLIEVKTRVTGAGEARRWSAESRLPMHSADRVDAENAACRIMDAVNQQLMVSGSKYRLVCFDTEIKEPVIVTYAA